mmetsp:Transcript_73784/g.227871  ORF Transcript_73784/g.227871 Transcript_73784/m.227871 type:complete len:205 (-) Transcript_73784:20-634(-)
MRGDHPLGDIRDEVHALLLHPPAQEHEDPRVRVVVEVAKTLRAVALFAWPEILVGVKRLLGPPPTLSQRRRVLRRHGVLGALVLEHGIVEADDLWQRPQNPVLDLRLLSVGVGHGADPEPCWVRSTYSMPACSMLNPPSIIMRFFTSAAGRSRMRAKRLTCHFLSCCEEMAPWYSALCSTTVTRGGGRCWPHARSAYQGAKAVW